MSAILACGDRERVVFVFKSERKTGADLATAHLLGRVLKKDLRTLKVSLWLAPEGQ